MNILEIALHAIADVTVHRDRRACDYKFQTLSTTPSLIHCSILSLSCRVLLINQSVKPVWFLENSGSPASLPHNTFKMHCVIWHDQWESPNSMGLHEPPNLINLSLFLCRVSIQSVKQCSVVTCVFDRCAHGMPCDQGHQALFLRGSSGGVTCLFITGWWLLPPEKTNRSNEAQGNYVADIAFASAISLVSVKKNMGDFF